MPGCFFACFGRSSSAVASPGQGHESRSLDQASDKLRPFCRPWNVTDEYIVTRKVLGYGLWGSVKVAKSKESGEAVALKTISKEMLGRRPARIPWLIELECHAAASQGGVPPCWGAGDWTTGANITELIAVYEDAKNLYMIMELCRGGDLFRHIAETRQTRVLGEEDIHRTACQLLQAVHHLHNQGIVHRDIKPENLLHEGGVLKICDFGSATQLQPGDPPLRDFVSTAFYAAPEVFGKRYGFKADVWSVGIVLYVMLPPVLTKQTCMENSEFASIHRGEVDVPEDASGGLASLIYELLQPDPDKRLSTAEALQHPWIARGALAAYGGAGVGVHHGFSAYFVARKLQHAATTLLAVLLSPGASQELSASLEKMCGEGGEGRTMSHAGLREVLLSLHEPQETCVQRLEEMEHAICMRLTGETGAGVGVGGKEGVGNVPFDTEEFLDVMRRRQEIVRREGEENLQDASDATRGVLPGSSLHGIGSKRWYDPNNRLWGSVHKLKGQSGLWERNAVNDSATTL